MYFYIYDEHLFWGRHQNLVTERHVQSWIFRNKPMRPNHWYISGDRSFMTTGAGQSGHWIITICEKDKGVLRPYILIRGHMYYFSDGEMHQTDPHEKSRWDTKNAFRNRLREYKGKYFLPFHKYACCV